MEEEFSKPDNQPKIELPLVTSLEVAASELHEMYLGLVWAGFSEKQALFILGTAVSGGMLSPFKHLSEENDFNNQDQDIDFDDLDDGDVF
jgi:hypothetical protein